MNESNAVHMNVSTGVITTGSQLDVTCLNCGSLRPEVKPNKSLWRMFSHKEPRAEKHQK